MIRTLETACNYKISHTSLWELTAYPWESTPKLMEITPKACGDKTNRKKTFNPTAGKV